MADQSIDPPRPDGERPAMSRLGRWRNDAILIALLVVLYLIVFRGSFLP